MKYFNNFKNHLNEKINITNYLSKLGKAETNKYPAEIKAFLDIISFAEGTYKYPEDGYKTFYSGKQFSDYSDHPRKIIKAGNYSSSAAGRYQFLTKTWDSLMKNKDFSPKNQDDGAVKLLKQNKAYRYLKNGNFKKALYNVRNIWASLPWSKYGQPTWYAKTDDDKFKILNDLYWARLKQYNPDIQNDLSIKDDIENNNNITQKKKRTNYNGNDKFPLIVGESSGENVRSLQNAIIKLGGKLPEYAIDGKFGPETMGASKFILSKLSENGEKIKGLIIDKLDKEYFNKIINSLNNEKIVKTIIPQFQKIEYNKYTENIPMKDGELLKNDTIYNVNSINNFIKKLKNKTPVNIYHIGDSHIKANYLTDTIKNGLSDITKTKYDKNAENGWTLLKHINNKSKIISDLQKNNYDLIIISLGANDGYIEESKFNINKYKTRYKELIKIIKDIKPNINIILTTPTSSVYPIKTKNINSNNILIQSAIYDIATDSNIAVWDIFKKMGGTNSILKWDKNGLVYDGLHFNKKGYEKIGDMFLSDLKKYL